MRDYLAPSRLKAASIDRYSSCAEMSLHYKGANSGRNLMWERSCIGIIRVIYLAISHKTDIVIAQNMTTKFFKIKEKIV